MACPIDHFNNLLKKKLTGNTNNIINNVFEHLISYLFIWPFFGQMNKQLHIWGKLNKNRNKYRGYFLLFCLDLCVRLEKFEMQKVTSYWLLTKVSYFLSKVYC